MEVGDDALVVKALEEIDLTKSLRALLGREATQRDALVDGLAPIGVLTEIDDTKLAAPERKPRLERAILRSARRQLRVDWLGGCRLLRECNGVT